MNQFDRGSPRESGVEFGEGDQRQDYRQAYSIARRYTWDDRALEIWDIVQNIVIRLWKRGSPEDAMEEYEKESREHEWNTRAMAARGTARSTLGIHFVRKNPRPRIVGFEEDELARNRQGKKPQGFLEWYASPRHFTVEDMVEARWALNEIRRVVRSFSDTVRRVVVGLIGLNGQPKTVKELAEEMHVSDQHIRDKAKVGFGILFSRELVPNPSHVQAPRYLNFLQRITGIDLSDVSDEESSDEIAA